LRRSLLLLGAAVMLAGCGTGGLVRKGDKDTGKTLFVSKCAGCHTLAAAGTTGTIGPNLDAAFAEARAEGYKESAIEDIVAGQIRAPGQYATDPSGKNPNFLTSNMPANIVRGQQLADVAAYVAANAGLTGFTQQVALTSTNGLSIFKADCGSCHTLAAAGTHGTVGPNLDQLKPPFARVQTQVINGGAIMPPFKSRLTSKQIAAVAHFVASHAGKK
jgi:cbb3-type cytochrome c oxidase subunit III